MDIALLRSSFEAVRPNAEAAAEAFYGTLLNTYPQVRPLFADTDFSQQRKKLMATLSLVVELVDRPDDLLPALDKMGHSHEGYGVTENMYPFVTASLLNTLAGYFGEKWTPEMATTWVEALDVVNARMIQAQRDASAA